MWLFNPTDHFLSFDIAGQDYNVFPNWSVWIEDELERFTTDKPLRRETEEEELRRLQESFNEAARLEESRAEAQSKTNLIVLITG